MYVVVCGDADNQNVQAVVNYWKKKHKCSIAMVPSADQVLPSLLKFEPQPVMIINASDTCLLDARLDAWIGRWVLATAPVWCTADAKSNPTWHVLCGMHKPLAEALGRCKSDDMHVCLQVMLKRGDLYCDYVPNLARNTLMPFARTPACISPSPRVQRLMTLFMKRKTILQVSKPYIIPSVVGLVLFILFLILLIKSCS